jgi:hypothetical protein
MKSRRREPEPEGCILGEGVTAPVITVFIRSGGGVPT